jgi:hypothetical protein
MILSQSLRHRPGIVGASSDFSDQQRRNVLRRSPLNPPIPPKENSCSIPHFDLNQTIEHFPRLGVRYWRQPLPQPGGVGSPEPFPTNSQSKALQPQILYPEPSILEGFANLVPGYQALPTVRFILVTPK